MCSSQMTRAAVTLSASLFVSSSKPLSCLSTNFRFSSTIFLWSSTQTIESSSFSLTASSCPMFPVIFWHVLSEEGEHKESKNGEREKTEGDDDKHSLADVPRAVCVTHNSLNHKKHTTAAKPSQKSSAKFSLVDSGPPTQTFSHAQKHANKRPPFQTLVTIPTTAFTHFSWWRFVLCHKRERETQTEIEIKRKNGEMREKKKERKAKAKRKKGQFILFERARLKKQKQTGKGAKQQRRWNKNSFTKKGWTNEKGSFFFFQKRKIKLIFQKKKKNQQRKQKRERESKQT